MIVLLQVLRRYMWVFVIIMDCVDRFLFMLFFFFQAEDGIRDIGVTGVQTCALPIFNNVADKAVADKQESVQAVLEGGVETDREALVQKIGENISPRRIAALSGHVIGSYVHSNNRIAVLVQLKGGDVELAKDIEKHVAASNTQIAKPEDVPEAVIAKEKDIYNAQTQDSGKPAEIIEKMVVGRVRKFLEEISLTKQPFVKDPDLTVGELAKKSGAEVVAFVRYEVGEGIEKEEVDFAAEVAAQLK